MIVGPYSVPLIVSTGAGVISALLKVVTEVVSPLIAVRAVAEVASMSVVSAASASLAYDDCALDVAWKRFSQSEGLMLHAGVGPGVPDVANSADV